MTERNDPIDVLTRQHKSDWTGICKACDAIWPCPPVRKLLNAVFAADVSFVLQPPAHGGVPIDLI